MNKGDTVIVDDIIEGVIEYDPTPNQDDAYVTLPDNTRIYYEPLFTGVLQIDVRFKREDYLAVFPYAKVSATAMYVVQRVPSDKVKVKNR